MSSTTRTSFTLKDGQTVTLASIKLSTVQGFPGDHFLFLTSQDGALRYVYACDLDDSNTKTVSDYIQKERASSEALSNSQ